MVGFCVAFFDPVGYEMPRRHALQSLRMLVDTGCPVALSQVVQRNGTPLAAPEGIARNDIYNSNDIIFYKENLWNLAAAQLADVEYIIFIDTDVYFRTYKWLNILRSLLDTGADIIQLFSQACWEDSAGRVIRTQPSVFNQLSRWHMPDFARHHVGFGFGFRADVFKRINGFFEKCPYGDGDAAFVCACSDSAHTKQYMRTSRSYDFVYNTRQYQTWRANILRQNFRLAAPPQLRMYHRWHGDLVDRQYNKHKHKNYCKWDPTRPEILKRRGDGLLRWTYEQEHMIQMWHDRKEDGDCALSACPPQSCKN